MRKGFTKITNSYLDQPWAKNPTVVYLYVWLCANADKDGRVVTSRTSLASETGLSTQQVRTALEKLTSTKFVTKLSTKLPTKFATTLNVCYLSGYKDDDSISNQVNNQVDNQVSNQVSRVYKNDNIIKSCLIEEDKDKNKSSLRSDLQKNQSSSEEDDVEQRFNEWMKNNFPFVSKMKRTLSLAQYNSLLDRGYTNEQVSSKLADMDNFAGIEKKYTNAHRTLLNWLKQDFGNKTKK